MGLLKQLQLRFRPPRRDDKDFGPLVYMYIPHAPERSYWEGEWLFPATKTPVAIALRGTVEGGPDAQSRAFYLSLPERFDRIMELARPSLDCVCREWLGRPLNADVWGDVKLAGFSVEDPGAVPASWDVSFETSGEKWLGITVPFVGDHPEDPIVDT
jgi:hypothetical protein